MLKVDRDCVEKEGNSYPWELSGVVGWFLINITEPEAIKIMQEIEKELLYEPPGGYEWKDSWLKEVKE